MNNIQVINVNMVSTSGRGGEVGGGGHQQGAYLHLIVLGTREEKYSIDHSVI